jgi:hypothetical protein
MKINKLNIFRSIILLAFLTLFSNQLLSKPWENFGFRLKESVCGQIFEPIKENKEIPNTIIIKQYYTLFDKENSQFAANLVPSYFKKSFTAFLDQPFMRAFSRCINLSKGASPFITNDFNYLGKTQVFEKIIFESLALHFALDLTSLKAQGPQAADIYYPNLKEIYINKITKFGEPEASLEWLPLLRNTDQDLKVFIHFDEIQQQRISKISSIVPMKISGKVYYNLRDLQDNQALLITKKMSIEEKVSARDKLLKYPNTIVPFEGGSKEKTILSILGQGLLTKSQLKKQETEFKISLDKPGENPDSVFLTEIDTMRFVAEENVRTNVETNAGFGIFAVIMEGEKLSKDGDQEAHNRAVVAEALNDSVLLVTPVSNIVGKFTLATSKTFTNLGIKEVLAIYWCRKSF